MKVKESLYTVLLLVLAILTGCVGGSGGTGGGVKSQINTVVDAYLQASLREDLAALKSSAIFAIQVTLSVEMSDGSFDETTLSRSELADMAAENWNWESRTYSFIDIVDRQTSVTGSTAILTGILIQRFQEAVDETCWLETADIELTFTKEASGWRISGYKLQNFSCRETNAPVEPADPTWDPPDDSVIMAVLSHIENMYLTEDLTNSHLVFAPDIVVDGQQSSREQLNQELASQFEQMDCTLAEFQNVRITADGTRRQVIVNGDLYLAGTGPDGNQQEHTMPLELTFEEVSGRWLIVAIVTPGSGEHTPLDQEIMAVLELICEMYSNEDLSLLPSIFAPEIVFTGNTITRDEFGNEIAPQFEQMDNIQVTFENVLGSVDSTTNRVHVDVDMRVSGTDQGGEHTSFVMYLNFTFDRFGDQYLIVALVDRHNDPGLDPGADAEAAINNITDDFVQACLYEDRYYLKSDAVFTDQVKLTVPSQGGEFQTQTLSRNELVDMMASEWNWDNRVYTEVDISGRNVTVTGSTAVLTGVLSLQYQESAGGSWLDTADIELKFELKSSGWRISDFKLMNYERSQLDSPDDPGTDPGSDWQPPSEAEITAVLNAIKSMYENKDISLLPSIFAPEIDFMGNTATREEMGSEISAQLEQADNIQISFENVQISVDIAAHKVHVDVDMHMSGTGQGGAPVNDIMYLRFTFDKINSQCLIVAMNSRTNNGTGTDDISLIRSLIDAFIEPCLDEDADLLKTSSFFSEPVTLQIVEENGTRHLQDLDIAGFVDQFAQLMDWANRDYTDIEILGDPYIVAGNTAALQGTLNQKFVNVSDGTLWKETASLELTFTKESSGWWIRIVSLGNIQLSQIN